MSDLKIVQGLIPYQEIIEDGQVVRLVDAREVYDFLEVKTQFSDWIQRFVKSFDFDEGVDFFSRVGKSPQGMGRPRTEYDVTLDMAKELAMMTKTTKGKQVRRYFIDVERKAVAQQPPQVQMGEETSKLFNTVLESVKQYSPTASQTVGIKMLKAYGIEVPYNALPLNVEHRWSATEIGEEIGVSGQMVGRVATKLGLKKQPFAQERLSVAANSNKEITMYYYNEAAKNKIERYINEKL